MLIWNKGIKKFIKSIKFGNKLIFDNKYLIFNKKNFTKFFQIQVEILNNIIVCEP